jgi:hypothetical protein
MGQHLSVSIHNAMSLTYFCRPSLLSARLCMCHNSGVNRALRERKIRYAFYPAAAVALIALADYASESFGVALGGGEHSWAINPIRTVLWVFIPMLGAALIGLKVADIADPRRRRRSLFLLVVLVLAVIPFSIVVSIVFGIFFNLGLI